MKTITNKKWCLLILSFAFFYSVNAQNNLKLFEGKWQMKDADGEIMYEEWHSISDSVSKGESYTMPGNKKQVLETVSLKYVAGKLCYAPTVKDQNEGKEVLFPLKEISDDGKKFIFENLQHDFPQRIIYHFKNETTLDARIEGKVEGKEKFSDYHFTKKIKN